MRFLAAAKAALIIAALYGRHGFTSAGGQFAARPGLAHMEGLWRGQRGQHTKPKSCGEDGHVQSSTGCAWNGWSGILRLAVGAAAVFAGAAIIRVPRRHRSLASGKGLLDKWLPWGRCHASVDSGAFAVRKAGEGQDSSTSDGGKDVVGSAQPVIFSCIFLHMLGFTMSGPLLPALRIHFALSASQTGLITSAFPLGMLAAVFVFPVLSDIVGRKPILVFTYFGVGVGMCFQALAVQLNFPFHVFICLRVLSGTFAGASTVAKAYLADVASPEQLPQLMAYRESAATLAFILGPALAGTILVFSSLPLILLVQGSASILAGLLAATLLVPPPSVSARRKSLPEEGYRNGEKEEEEGCPITYRAPWLATFTIISIACAYNFGLSFYDGFFPILCSDRFSLSAPAIGTVQTASALVVFVGTAGLYGSVVKRLGLVQTATIGLFLIAGGLAQLGMPRTWSGALPGLLMYGIGIPLFAPSMPTLLSLCAPPGRRGLVLGIDSAVTTVGRILAPVILGSVYEASPARAFGLMGAVVAAGAMVMLIEKKGLSRVTRPGNKP